MISISSNRFRVVTVSGGLGHLTNVLGSRPAAAPTAIDDIDTADLVVSADYGVSSGVAAFASVGSSVVLPSGLAAADATGVLTMADGTLETDAHTAAGLPSGAGTIAATAATTINGIIVAVGGDLALTGAVGGSGTPELGVGGTLLLDATIAGGGSANVSIAGTLNAVVVTASGAGAAAAIPAGVKAGYLLDESDTLQDTTGGAALTAAAPGCELIEIANDSLFGVTGDITFFRGANNASGVALDLGLSCFKISDTGGDVPDANLGGGKKTVSSDIVLWTGVTSEVTPMLECRSFAGLASSGINDLLYLRKSDDVVYSDNPTDLSARSCYAMTNARRNAIRHGHDAAIITTAVMHSLCSSNRQVFGLPRA